MSVSYSSIRDFSLHLASISNEIGLQWALLPLETKQPVFKWGITSSVKKIKHRNPRGSSPFWRFPMKVLELKPKPNLRATWPFWENSQTPLRQCMFWSATQLKLNSAITVHIFLLFLPTVLCVGCVRMLVHMGFKIIFHSKAVGKAILCRHQTELCSPYSSHAPMVLHCYEVTCCLFSVLKRKLLMWQ